jgi:hypothetical protein
MRSLPSEQKASASTCCQATHRYSVLSVVCMGTLYHCAWVVAEGGGTPSSLKCAEVFRDGWLQFGPPMIEEFTTVDNLQL